MPSPIEPRFGTTGTGLYIGCGAGVGFLTPISLHSVPVVGQIASSMSQSLYKLEGLIRFLQPLRMVLRRGGMDAGVGCGVALGYGWGAGLFLTPSAGQTLTAKMTSLLAGLQSKVPGLDRLNIQPGQPQGTHGGVLDGIDIQQSATPFNASIGEIDTSLTGSKALEQQQQLSRIEKDVAQLGELVQQQQSAMTELQRQVATMQNLMLETNIKGRK